MAEEWIVPVRRVWGIRFRKKMGVVCVRDLTCGQQKFVHPHAMNRTLVVLSVLRSHQERTGRNGDQSGFEREASGTHTHQNNSRCHPERSEGSAVISTVSPPR